MLSKPTFLGLLGLSVLVSALGLNFWILPEDEIAEAPVARSAPDAPTTARPSPQFGQETTAPPRAATGGTVDAAAPSKAPAAAVPATPIKPSFDIVRVDPEGNAVIAGRAAPNREIAILDADREIGRVTTDDRGEWVFVPATKLAPGERVLSLREISLGETPSIESDEAVVLVIPEPGKDIAGRPSQGPSTPLAVVLPRGDVNEGGRLAARILQAPVAGADTSTPTAPSGAGASAPIVSSGADAAASGAGASAPITSSGADAAASGAGASVPITSSGADAAASGAGASAPIVSSGTDAAASGAGASVPITSSGADASIPAASSGAGMSAPIAAASGAAVAGATSAPDVSPSQAGSAAAPSAVGAPSTMASATSANAAATPGTSARPAPEASVAREGAGPIVSAFPEAVATAEEQAGAADTSVDVIDYDDKGSVVFSGRTESGAEVEVFIDNEKLGAATADTEGRWRFQPPQPVEPGQYKLRVDRVDSAGVVRARAALPFVRADPLAALPMGRLVVIQPGNNLWRISARIYGSGFHFVQIYDANQDQIRNPDLIYPGQVFELPRVN